MRAYCLLGEQLEAWQEEAELGLYATEHGHRHLVAAHVVWVSGPHVRRGHRHLSLRPTRPAGGW